MVFLGGVLGGGDSFWWEYGRDTKLDQIILIDFAEHD